MAKIKKPTGKAGKVEKNILTVAPYSHNSIATNNAKFMKSLYGWRLLSTREIRRKLLRVAKKYGVNNG